MAPLFGRREAKHAFAEVLEDAEEISRNAMSSPKYNRYRGAEPMFDVAVRVEPDDGPPYQATMEAGLSVTFLLKPGVRVAVGYDPSKPQHVTLEDGVQAVLDRNPQLKKQ